MSNVRRSATGPKRRRAIVRCQGKPDQASSQRLHFLRKTLSCREWWARNGGQTIVSARGERAADRPNVRSRVASLPHSIALKSIFAITIVRCVFACCSRAPRFRFPRKQSAQAGTSVVTCTNEFVGDPVFGLRRPACQRDPRGNQHNHCTGGLAPNRPARPTLATPAPAQRSATRMRNSPHVVLPSRGPGADRSNRQRAFRRRPGRRARPAVSCLAPSASLATC